MGAVSLLSAGGAKFRITRLGAGRERQVLAKRAVFWVPASRNDKSEPLPETVSQFTPYVHDRLALATKFQPLSSGTRPGRSLAQCVNISMCQCLNVSLATHFPPA
jgi:hypothetical protein